MEGVPTPEQNITKADVIAALEKHSWWDPNVQTLVLRWTEQQEKLAENDARAKLRFDIDRADLYLAAGDTEGAIETLEQVRMQADYQAELGLYDEATAKIDDIIRKL